MGSLSIRGMDEELSKRLKEAARRSNRSVSQYVLELLRQQTGIEKSKRFTTIHSDLDHLFGTWSEEEHEAVQGKIDAESTIDDELWK